MRLSEMYWRTWEEVDLTRRMLTVPRSKHGERRHVPLNSVAIAALTELKSRREAQEERKPCDASNDAEESDWIFLNARGQRLTGSRKWFEAAIKETRIQNFHWHDLRHTFASRLIMGGMDLRTVQELMGHKTVSMTCRYAHLAPTHQLAAVDRLADINRAIKETRPEPSKTAEATDTTTDTKATATVRKQPSDALQTALM
jgi:site-specific recombinase XerD